MALTEKELLPGPEKHQNDTNHTLPIDLPIVYAEQGQHWQLEPYLLGTLNGTGIQGLTRHPPTYSGADWLKVYSWVYEERIMAMVRSGEAFVLMKLFQTIRSIVMNTSNEWLFYPERYTERKYLSTKFVVYPRLEWRGALAATGFLSYIGSETLPADLQIDKGNINENGSSIPVSIIRQKAYLDELD